MAKQNKGRKLFATAASAALVATALTPAAFAAETTSFKDADKIAEYAKESVEYLVGKGAISGYNGSFNPKGELTRAEAATILAKALDLKVDESKKTTFEDAKDHWASEEIAALQAYNKDIITGFTDGTFRPDEKITRAQLALIITTAYGLKQDESAVLNFTDNNAEWSKGSINTLASLGIVAGTTTTTFSPNAVVTREQAAAFFHRTEVPAKRLPVETSALEVTSVSAINLKQFVVTFNSAIDKDTAVKANFTFDESVLGEDDKLELSEDGKSVLVTLNTKVTNQTSKELIVKDVKNVNGSTLEEYKTNITFADFTAPTATRVVSAGPDKLKVIFSEPVDTTTAQTIANYSINDGQFFIQDAEVTGLNEVTVSLYSTLADGEYNVKVKNVEDLAGFKVAETTLKLSQVADTSAPSIAKVVEASPNKVVFEFTEDIILNDTVDNLKAKIYHTNSSNTPSNIEVDGKKLTLTFSNENALPKGGTAYFVIEKDVVKDGWNNKNAKYEANISVVVDTTKPTVSTLEAPKDNQLKVTYSEDVTNSAITAANYTLLDSTGKKVEDVTLTPSFEVKDGVTSAKVVLIGLSKSVPGGTYTLVSEKVKDIAGNEIDKVSKSVTVKDSTAPTVEEEGVLYSGKKIVKIKFSEAMATSGTGSVLDLANYQFGGTYLNTTKAKATITDNGKAVLIDYSATDLTIADSNKITVGKVTDVTGNSTTAFTSEVTVKNAASVGIDSVEATGTKTIKVTLEDTLSKFDANDFVVKVDGSEAASGFVTSVSFANVDGKGVITYTLKDELKTNATSEGKVVSVGTKDAAIASENSYGVKVKQNASAVAATDKIVAVVEKFNHDDDVNTDEVFDVQVSFTDADEDGKIDKEEEAKFYVNFSENLNADTISRLSFEVAGFTVTSVALDETDNSKVVITADAKNDNLAINTLTVKQVLDLADANDVIVKGGTTYTVAK